MPERKVLAELRYRLLGLSHVGRLRPGARLPSIRQLARDTGTDHREVAEAYRMLAEEGVVEIRPGSGVYVSSRQSEGLTRSASAEWMADLMTAGWKQRLPRAATGALVRRCAEARVRCACIESNRDHLAALRGELEEDFGLEVVEVLVTPGADADRGTHARLAGCAFGVTTTFHERVGRLVADSAGVPLVCVSLHEDFIRELERRLRSGRLTVVAVDSRFIERGEAYLAVTSHQAQVRFVLVSELRAMAPALDVEAEDVLATRAARERLGMERYHLLPPPAPMISMASAREIHGHIACEAISPAASLPSDRSPPRPHARA